VLLALGGIGEASFALQSVLGAITSSIIVGGIMGVSYLLLLWLLRSQEIQELGMALRGRFTRNGRED
jgi:hypothetical protein